MYNYPRVGVAVFVQKGSQFLFGRRKGSHGDGSWALPGGHLEKYESPEECATREVFEESGLIVQKPLFFTISNDVSYGDKKHYVTIYMISEYKSGKPCILEPERCYEWAWRSWDDIQENEFLPLQNLRIRNINPLQKIQIQHL